MRASAAGKEFEKNGVPASWFARIVGYADREPLNVGNPTDPRNRRIAIILLR